MDDLLVARIVLGSLMIGSGSLLWWVARATASGRLGRNKVAGIRVPATLASDEAWRAAHQRAERPTLVGAALAGLSGVAAFVPGPEELLVGVVVLGCLGMLGPLLYALDVGAEAARQREREKNG